MRVTLFAALMLTVTTAFVFINSALITNMTNELSEELCAIPNDVELIDEY